MLSQDERYVYFAADSLVRLQLCPVSSSIGPIKSDGESQTHSILITGKQRDEDHHYSHMSLLHGDLCLGRTRYMNGTHGNFHQKSNFFRLALLSEPGLEAIPFGPIMVRLRRNRLPCSYCLLFR